MSRLPIRLRVTAAFALAMALVLAASGLFLYLRLGSHLATTLDGELRLRAQDLAALVEQPHASLESDTAARLVESGESYAQLLDANGRVLEATRPLGAASLLTPVQLAAASRGPAFGNRARVPGLDEGSRLLAVPIRHDGHPAVLVVGATRQDRAETLAEFRRELLIAGPLALLLASLAGYLLAGLSLRQVEAMRRRAAGVTGETPGERLPVPPTGDELQRLGETLNAMLGRLEDALERERGFVADAGHELRTPLALLRTELELALRQTDSVEELREAVRRASQETDRLSQLAEDLLLLARVERGRLPLRIEEIEVADLLGTVAARFAWRAEEAGTLLAVESANGLRVRGDRLRLEQALGNLIDNALRYGGEVHVGACAFDGRVELHVVDRGEGFPAGFRERAFDRFARAEPVRGHAGAGLGLSIVSAIAAAHGGRAQTADADPQGADVWIELPVTLR